VSGRAIEAVIFDMDGLLIDTEPIWRQAEQLVMAGVGVQLSDADVASTTGVRIDEVVAHWRCLRPWPLHPATSVTALAKSIVDQVIAHVLDQGAPQPGVGVAIAAARKLGVGVAIASSSPPRLIEAVCRRLGLDEISIRCSAVHEREGKPAPDVYLTAARCLGVEPSACVALEDSPNGVRSAVAAGMRCIAVPDPLLTSDPAFAAAAVMLGSLAEVTPALLAGGVAA